VETISINNKTYIEVIYFNLLGTVIKFSPGYSLLYCRRKRNAAYFFTNNCQLTLFWSHDVHYFIVRYFWGYFLGQDLLGNNDNDNDNDDDDDNDNDNDKDLI